MIKRRSLGTAHAPAVDPATLPAVLTTVEAARLLRVGINGLYRAVRLGEIPAIRVGRTLRFSRDGLLRQFGADAVGAAPTESPDGAAM